MIEIKVGFNRQRKVKSAHQSRVREHEIDEMKITIKTSKIFF